jgi:hypothetical protein
MLLMLKPLIVVLAFIVLAAAPLPPRKRAQPYP